MPRKKSTTEPLVRVTIRLPDGTMDQLALLNPALPAAEVIRLIIKNYLKTVQSVEDSTPALPTRNLDI